MLYRLLSKSVKSEEEKKLIEEAINKGESRFSHHLWDNNFEHSTYDRTHMCSLHYTPLHLAVASQDLTLVKKCVEAGFKVKPMYEYEFYEKRYEDSMGRPTREADQDKRWTEKRDRPFTELTDDEKILEFLKREQNKQQQPRVATPLQETLSASQEIKREEPSSKRQRVEPDHSARPDSP